MQCFVATDMQKICSCVDYSKLFCGTEKVGILCAVRESAGSV